MRVLALDIGERRIGVALSDPTGLLASPLTVIESVGPRRDVQRVLALTQEHGVECIVVGNPLTMDGASGWQARVSMAFRERLAASTEIPTVLWDERLTSVEAERRLRESGAGPARRRIQRDAVAAAILLQAYLDSRRSRGR